MFEKQHGDRQAIDDVILSKRRAEYEKRLDENEHDYDTWFDYLRLEIDAESAIPRIRDVFERAVAAVPPVPEKQFWLRYIYIWIKVSPFLFNIDMSMSIPISIIFHHLSVSGFVTMPIIVFALR